MEKEILLLTSIFRYMKTKHTILSVILIAFFVSCSDEGGINTTDIDESKVNQADLITNNLLTGTSTPIEGQYIVVLNSGELSKIKPSDDAQRKQLKGVEAKTFYQSAVSKMKEEIAVKRSIDFGLPDESIKTVYGFAIEGFTAELTSDEVERLRNDPRVQYVVQDQLISLMSAGGSSASNVRATAAVSSAQITPWGITRVGGAGNGTGKTAWIIDTGIDLDHPDLNVDVARSISFTGDNNPDDGNGHGTHVAGTVAAKDNNIGVVGVAAGANVVALKVLGDNGRGAFSWTVQAIDYVAAVAQSGDAANMSLGPDNRLTDPLTDQATKNLGRAGIKVAMAAGNSNDDSRYYSPGRNNGPNLYTVSALAKGDFFVYFSNYGSPVDYIAPGFNIESTWIGGGYNTSSGTSMASPHVCGLLLLGEISTDGFAKNGYWEVRGWWNLYATGRISENDIYSRSVYIADPDGNADPIAHR